MVAVIASIFLWDTHPEPDDEPLQPKHVDESFALPQRATGINEEVLIRFMNSNPLPEVMYHHEFKHNSTDKAGSPERLSLYQDTHNELFLLLAGAPDDLTMMQLIMSLKEFTGEVDGKATGVGAAAFGRCMQRMTFIANPSWCNELYDWMNDNMVEGLVRQDGVTTSKGPLIARFSTFKSTEDELMVCLTIGVRAIQESRQ